MIATRCSDSLQTTMVRRFTPLSLLCLWCLSDASFVFTCIAPSGQYAAPPAPSLSRCSKHSRQREPASKDAPTVGGPIIISAIYRFLSFSNGHIFPFALFQHLQQFRCNGVHPSCYLRRSLLPPVSLSPPSIPSRLSVIVNTK